MKLSYKIISNVISNRLKFILSLGISKEQFGLLHWCHIFYCIWVAQETIPFAKDKCINCMVSKIDLMNPSDTVDWSFLQLILINVGLSHEVTQWIMGCVTSIKFNVLVNGSPSRFFKGSRGLRQCFPLSPLFFFLSLRDWAVWLTRKNMKVGIEVSNLLLPTR